MRISVGELVDFTTRLFRATGVPKEHARTTALRLVEADARGRTGHGLVRAVPYLERIAAGGLNITPDVVLQNETPVSAQVDGDNGLGQVVMTRATEVAASKALANGVAVVGTVRSNHAGAAGLYPAMLAERGLVGIYLAVANANGMPPWGGIEPILGTNPIAVAIPAAVGAPFVLDIATTVASHGTIKVARMAGRPMPVGWVADASGEPITDPARADEGFLQPIGGYKGAGLNVAVGLLAGVLNGAVFGREVVDQRADLASATNTGQLLIAFRVDLFRPLEEVLVDLAGHLEQLRGSRSVDGRRLRLPGDRAAELWSDSAARGLELPEVLHGDLNAAATRLGVKGLPTTTGGM